MNSEQINECLSILFPVSTTFGLILLLAAHAAMSNKEGDDYRDRAYKYAMWGGLTLFASLILLAMRATH